MFLSNRYNDTTLLTKMEERKQKMEERIKVKKESLDVVEEVKIKKLNLDRIHPNLEQINQGLRSRGSFKLTCIGKSGSGKTKIIESIIREKKKFIPCGTVISSTEPENKAFENMGFPPLFIHTKYKESIVANFLKRQKFAVANLENPWAILVLDDVIDDPSILKTNIYKTLYKFGRHSKFLFILSLQYCFDVTTTIRTNTDGIIIMRDPILSNRKKLWENYASIIPTFKLFCTIMNDVTDDYTALYIDNISTSNDFRDCIYWYKADLKAHAKKKLVFGSKITQLFNEMRLKQNYGSDHEFEDDDEFEI